MSPSRVSSLTGDRTANGVTTVTSNPSAASSSAIPGADVVAIGVVHDHPVRGRPLARAHLFRGEHVPQRRVRAGHRVRVAGLGTVPAPGRAGGDHDQVRAIVQDVRRS